MNVWQEEFPDFGWDKWLPSRMRLYRLSAWLMTTPSLFSLITRPFLWNLKHQKYWLSAQISQVPGPSDKRWWEGVNNTGDVNFLSRAGLDVGLLLLYHGAIWTQRLISITTSYYRMQQVFGSLGTRYFHRVINILVTGQDEKLLTNTKWKSKVHWTA